MRARDGRELTEPKAKTIFHADRAAFSRRAHKAAEAQIYKTAFGEYVSIESAVGSDDDLKSGIDYRIRVYSRSVAEPIQFTVQERWRRPRASRFREITMTEYDIQTRSYGEMYKIAADFLMYGYYNEKKRAFGEVIIVPVSALLLLLAKGAVEGGRKQIESKNAIIRTVPFDELFARRLVAYHSTNGVVHINDFA